MKLVKRIILLTLTLLVLVTSTGLSVGLHFCAGDIRDLSFFGNAAECPMEKQKEALPSCHKPKAPQDKDDCCDDHQLVIERHDVATDTEALQLTKLPDFKFAAIVQAVFLQLYFPEVSLKPAYALYTSPPVVRDIPVLVQSFLL
ncbi:hypothetical protein H7F15_11480 [Pontibacter sp. Tf4]|uniref:HYC_CC_PP family protein n=1 Tax=Pontibacter sp. Tf4 TaxID=2761620 RepID=UPI0016288963|nr:hypothetical protein [Pontibacter sp. Tf4]MBB6611661.1 hypothetical protein [Pontibacter sp. Tf4]